MKYVQKNIAYFTLLKNILFEKENYMFMPPPPHIRRGNKYRQLCK